MRLSFLGTGQALNEIASRLGKNGYRCRMAVAFLRYDGLTRLERGLKRAEGRIVVGASSFCITDWEALDRLRQICDSNPKLFVRKIYNERFHPKAFHFEKGDQAVAIVGSSNLTGGGLEKNVEANVLVEGTSDNAFLQNVKAFVDSLYDEAEPLNDAFIDKYRHQVAQRNRAGSRSGPGLSRTPLSSAAATPASHPPASAKAPFPRTLKWWKIAPGPDGSDWPIWKEHIDSRNRGFVSMGWSSAGDLGEKLGWDREKFHRTVAARVEAAVRRGRYSSNPDYAARQMWQFGSQLKSGDMVVAYSQSTIFGIGRVIGGYLFRPSTETYEHTRRVQWLTLPAVKPPKTMMQKGLATNRTISAITDEDLIDYLRRQIH